MRLVLVINSGSSSLRFSLMDCDSGRCTARGYVERIGAVSSIATYEVDDGPRERLSVKAKDHGVAMEMVLDFLIGHEAAPIESADDVKAVGHRVVHGGERFSRAVSVDDEVISAIADAFDLAPLHNPANLKGIEAARRALPNAVHVAVFDTAFHHTMPASAYAYALPERLRRRHRIRRYGFHGPSHYFVSRRLYEISRFSQDESRLITCHLGNGASMCAIRNGESVDTSMGLTPLSGLVMGTRCGDVDPSVVFELVEKEELPLSEVHTLLNRHSGLLGLSGYASDMRDLLKEAEAGDARCRHAIDVFCYRARAYIGQYMAVLNGCDVIVFTAGIGEHSAEVRAQICAGLENLGVRLDDARNRDAVGVEARISADGSGVEVWVIPTDEELVIARDALDVAADRRRADRK
ncbi:MAG TPA: acetate kinase [Gammaproteobacteria bacterium]|nr:acetate kinase [Gammaproteobacteria bacterium]